MTPTPYDSPFWNAARANFPELPAGTLPPVMPDGFTDSSWRNDVSPSAVMQGADENDMIRIWFESPDPAEREIPEGGRYIVTLCDMAHGDELLIYEGDDWAEVLAMFAKPESFMSAAGRPIRSWADAAAYLSALHHFGKVYHLEDSPAEVVAFRDDPEHLAATGSAGLDRVFTGPECAAMEARAVELYNLDTPDPKRYCPIFLMMTIDAGLSRAKRGGYD